MEWYEKIALYTILGFTMVKFWEATGYLKDKINGVEETEMELIK